METATQLVFEGTEEEKDLASKVFEVMKRKGILFAANAPIRMNLDAIVTALTKEGAPLTTENVTRLTPRVESALGKNSRVFAQAGRDYVTTKSGHAPHVGTGSNDHTFKQRINTEAQKLNADAAKEYAESLLHRVAERDIMIDDLEDEAAPAPQLRAQYMQQPPLAPRAAESSAQTQHLIPAPPRPPEPEIEDEPEPIFEPPLPAKPQVVTQSPATTAAAAPATHAPAQPQTPAGAAGRRVQDETAAAPARPGPSPIQVPAQGGRLVDSAHPPVIEKTLVAPVQPAASAGTTETPSARQTASAATGTGAPITETPKPVEKPKPVVAAKPVEPPQPVITGPIEASVPTAKGPVTINLVDPIDEILLDDDVAAGLEALIVEALRNESRFVSFGADYYPEEAVERFSKGDFRRIREYLEEPETGGVASDRDIMNDVLGRRPEQPDYERWRYALNFRLLREKKDFEFVGVDSDRLWIIANSAPVTPPARKPAEIGTDYRFLEDPAVVQAEEEDLPGKAIGPIDYSLTYYEYENGVLPYDRVFKRIFPGAVFDDQRSSLVRFEVPQLYGAVIGELRYPTGNRGGFIMGMGDLFTDHMVPGAKFTILPTDRGDDVFEIRFSRHDEIEENLLQFDDRKSRYVFRPVSYTVDTNPAMLLTQDKYPQLHNQKKLDDSERKKPDLIITAAFEAVAENLDGKFWAVLDDLFPVVNIDRPISRSWLRVLLSGAYPHFYADPDTEGAYFYDPAKKQT